MAAMPKDVAPRGRIGRALFVRLFCLWLTGALGIGMLYLLWSDAMTPTRQETMAQTQIFSYRGWQSTGIRLQANETAVIRATGDWLYTPGEWHDANGHRRYPAPSFYPLSGVAGGVLLGRIGENGSVQSLGSRGRLWATEPGMLYLRINDDILSDNQGSLSISINVIPAPQAMIQ